MMAGGGTGSVVLGGFRKKSLVKPPPYNIWNVLQG